MLGKPKFKKGDICWYFDTYLWREIEVKVSIVTKNGYGCVDKDGERYFIKERELFATKNELLLSL